MKKQILAVSLSLLTVLNPLYPAIDQVMADNGFDGSLNINPPNKLSIGKQKVDEVWAEQKETYTTPIETDGGTKFYFPKTLEGKQVTDGSGEDSINIYELFGQEKSDHSAKNNYGINSSSFEQKGLDARAQLQMGSSIESKAYATLRDSLYVSKPNLDNDPIWTSSKAVQDMIAGRELECDPETSHEPDYKTCFRPNVGKSSCVITHPYEAGVIEHYDGPVNYQSCGEGCIAVWLGKVGDNYWSGSCKIFEHNMKLKMINPDAITKAVITNKKWDDHMQIYVADELVWNGPYQGVFPPETSGSCELSTSWSNSTPVDVTSVLKSKKKNDIVGFKIRTSVTGAGEGYAKMVISYDPNKVVTNDVWENDKCIRLANDYVSAYGVENVSAYCSDMPPTDAETGCLQIDGVVVCEENIKPLWQSNIPFNTISPLCRSIVVTAPDGAPVSGSQSCNVEHVVEASKKEAIISIGGIGQDYNAIEFDLKDGTYQPISPSDTSQVNADIPVLDYAEICGSGKNLAFTLNSAEPWFGSGFEDSNSVDASVFYKVLQAPSCANGLVGRVMVEDTDKDDSGTSLLNGTFFLELPKLIEKDGWYNSSCIDIANDPKYKSTVECIDYHGVSAGDCATINGAYVCPSDLFSAPLPVDRMCKTALVSYTSPSGESINSCEQYEEDKSCGFISSSCKDETPEETVEKLYTRGLGRSPSSSEISYWVGQLERDDLTYDQVVWQFFSAAGVNNEQMVNSFSCNMYEEVWDCGYSEGGTNAGACAVQDLFANDFADCKEELVETIETEEIVTTRYESCEDLLILTECDAYREITETPKSSTQKWTRGCFIEDTVSYQLPWHERAAVASASLQVSGQHTSASIIQHPTLSNNWTAKVHLQGSGEYKKVKDYISCPAEDASPEDIPEDLVTETTESGETVCYTWRTTDIVECPSNHSLTATLSVTGSTLDYKDKDVPAEGEEVNSPCQRVSDEWTDATWFCEETQTVTAAGKPISAAIRNALFPELFPGENGYPSICVKGHVDYETKEYTQGEFCYENMDEETICIDVDSNNGAEVGNNTCEALEARADCNYVGKFPVENSEGSTGFNYVYEHRYSCVSQVHEVETRTLEPAYTCEGVVECLGDECATLNREASTDFGQAASMLEMLEGMGRDMECEANANNDLTNCKVFSGEAGTCKIAVGGVVDCCEKPEGVSIADYIKLYHATGRIDNMLMNMDSMPGLKGAYTSLRDPIANGLETVTKPIVSAFDQVTGGVLDLGGEVAGEGLMSGIKQQVMQMASDFVYEAFGPEVQSALFDVAADGAVQGFAAPVMYLMYVYMIYQIVMLVIQIIWECTDEEFELNVARELKKTHYLGTYCRKKVLGACIEKRQSYCEFASPLSRIINEQARPQLGITWGTAENPNCRGLTLEEINRIDWSQIDLTEWMDLLKISGNLPETRELNMQTMTSGQSPHLQHIDPDRKDIRTRTEERIKDIDINTINNNVGQDIRSGL